MELSRPRIGKKKENQGKVCHAEKGAELAREILQDFHFETATIEDIVRTRVYIRNVDDWEPVSRAHGQRFGKIRPANTLVQADLIGDDYLVEIEAEAVVGRGEGR